MSQNVFKLSSNLNIKQKCNRTRRKKTDVGSSSLTSDSSAHGSSGSVKKYKIEKNQSSKQNQPPTCTKEALRS